MGRLGDIGQLLGDVMGSCAFLIWVMSIPMGSIIVPFWDYLIGS